jgi:hypothetical protein
MANIIALECSAALPTIGSKITLMKATGTLDDKLHIHSLLSTTILFVELEGWLSILLIVGAGFKLLLSKGHICCA